MSLTISDIYLGLGGQHTQHAPAALPVSEFVIDSRLAQPESCFIALHGENADGHAFIADAVARGAMAVIAEHAPEDIDAHIVRPNSGPAPTSGDKPIIFLVENSLQGLQRLARFWREQLSPTVIGITGSVGKTSTKELTAAVLRQRYPTLWTPGNYNNEIGLPLSLLRLRPEHRFAVLEMGFYTEGEIAALCEIAKPAIGVITNIGPIHLERAGSMEAIFRGKSELIRSLPPQGHAVLNWDDLWVKKMEEMSPAPVFKYGLNEEADLWADEIESYGLSGIHFRFHHRQKPGHVKTLYVHLPLLGRHSVHTALRAAAAGLLAGLSWEEIITGLRDVNAQLRIDIAPGYHNSTIIDDTYNASPPSTIAALNLLQDMQGRHIAILGDMLELGSAEEQGHRLVGARAAETSEILIAVGQRSQKMAEEARFQGMPEHNVHAVTDIETAIHIAKKLIQPGDYILVKGSRAMRMDEIVAQLTVPTP
ncbi:MAG: UDP-N-acetylmuramoylalanyl-D-glutamyl-2, 6-diaminopimelate--D-alanyl-D-alanine ligase [Clostridia bacterium]|nr:MAG: UDP-N-acetylmuramoylalanyl-D-glutamyl-2, 6-diaminopimelate--D-alanyl-D-alanine ligase [Clostridia bacterium]